MTERPEEPEPTSPYLAKPASPSGDQQPPPPTTPYPVPPPAGGGPGVPSPYSGQPYPAYQPYGGAYPYGGQRAHQGATAAMGLGITSLVCALGTFVVCITLPGVLCGPFAVALALLAQRDMRRNPGQYNNEGAATTGLVTGIIGTIVGLVIAGLAVFILGSFWAVGS